MLDLHRQLIAVGSWYTPTIKIKESNPMIKITGAPNAILLSTICLVMEASNGFLNERLRDQDIIVPKVI